jgi:Transposase DDE domain
LHEASQCQHVQKRLRVARASLGSMSESSHLFDPELLEPMIRQLLAEFTPQQSGPGPDRHIPETIPHELACKLVAVDGTALKALPRIAGQSRNWKLHLHFRVLPGLPASAVLTREGEAGHDERDVLEAGVEKGRVYICDRGYERYALNNRIVAAGSDYVIRGKNRPFEVVEERPVSAEAWNARVVADQVVRLSPGTNTTRAERIDHPVRRIVLARKVQHRPRADRPPSEEVILLTSLMDVPAEVIAAIYELRWTIELFFRFLKQMLGCRELKTENPNAAMIQMYCALIACLLLAQATGGKVTRTVYRMICFYLQGWASEEELNACLDKARQANAAKQQPCRTG